MRTSITDDELLANYKKFEQLCSKLGSRTPNVMKMLDDIGERLAVAPASTRQTFHCAFPGGLVDHTLRVCKNALTIRNTFDVFSDIDNENVIFASLFHDIGKVGEPGSDGADHYVPQESSWHREKLGQFFQLNEDIQYMSNVDRTVMMLLHYGIVPTQDEYLAIKLNDGPYDQANHEYNMREPKLATIIHMADRMACMMEKCY